MTTITTKLTEKEAVTFAQLRSSHPSPSMMIPKMAISADEDFPNLPIFVRLPMVVFSGLSPSVALGRWSIWN